MRPSRRTLLAHAVVLAACASQHLQAQASNTPNLHRRTSHADSLAAALDEKAPGWLAASGVPSISVAYIKDGAVQWVRAHGEQSQGVPATPRTVYNVASLAKPVFAETMLRLAGEGRISLDEPLAGHWIDPDVAGDPRHRRLTPRIALSHRTGFKNWRFQTEGVLRFDADPGTALGYSGEGFEYTRRFAEKKLGESFESLAARYVLGPSGMTSTAHTRREWFAGRIAIPRGPEGRYGDPSIQDTANAADDLYTTAGDYAAFVISVMNRDRLPAAIAAQRDSIHAVNPSPNACGSGPGAACPTRVGMGLGWEILEFPRETVRMHTGGDWGESAMAFYFAGRGEGAVILTNGASGMKVILEVMDLLFHDTDLAASARSYRDSSR